MRMAINEDDAGSFDSAVDCDNRQASLLDSEYSGNLSEIVYAAV